MCFCLKCGRFSSIFFFQTVYPRVAPLSTFDIGAHTHIHSNKFMQNEQRQGGRLAATKDINGMRKTIEHWQTKTTTATTKNDKQILSLRYLGDAFILRARCCCWMCLDVFLVCQYYE